MLLPEKEGIYFVRGTIGSDFEGQYFVVHVEKHRPENPFFTYDFYPKFFGEFTRKDFECVEL
jgi:hypothetical protein